MTLNKRKLKKYCESMWIRLTKEQECAILEQFGTEPEPYEWSEQDISVQIKNYLSCGKFVKEVRRSGGPPVFLFEEDFYL